MSLMHFPVVFEVQDDDAAMEDIMSDLSEIGFMSRTSFSPVYPYMDFRDDFYEKTGTYPTYVLLSDDGFDTEADGAVVELLGEEELVAIEKDLSCEIHYLDYIDLLELLDAWL